VQAQLLPRTAASALAPHGEGLQGSRGGAGATQQKEVSDQEPKHNAIVNQINEIKKDNQIISGRICTKYILKGNSLF
jgi:hypothetical protein